MSDDPENDPPQLPASEMEHVRGHNVESVLAKIVFTSSVISSFGAPATY